MRAFQTGHEELIHDLRYDLYGRHVATASSDQHIKVFDFDSATSTWVLNDLWKAHDLLVVKLSWAHPEFSNARVLASCSYDRTVKIWQELPDELHGSGRRWMKLATLAMELFGPIYDVQFAPAHLGLKLACVGSDGIVRMYESVEPSDLSEWSLTAEIPILNLQLPAKNLQSSFCIEWCPSKFAKFEKFAVIALDQGFIYSTVKRSAKELSQSGNLDIANASMGDSTASIHTLQLDLGPDRLAPLAENTGGDVREERSAQSSFVKICNLPEHNGLIRSISWAPSMGRSYHLIATGCKDGLIQIFKAHEQENGDFKIETVARLNDHRLEVWRVQWNSTGTILSSAGDDGRIRLWKCTHLNEWKCMSIINSSYRLDAQIAGEDEPTGFPSRSSIGKSKN